MILFTNCSLQPNIFIDVNLYFVRVLPRTLRRKVPAPERPTAESFIPGTQSVYIKTWGCSHNNSDGEYMAGLLAASGYTITGRWRLGERRTSLNTFLLHTLLSEEVGSW